jgi:septal ring factor EnvC (AmiA/AmiB activator)
MFVLFIDDGLVHWWQSWHSICKACADGNRCLYIAASGKCATVTASKRHQQTIRDNAKMAEDDVSEADLSGRLATVLEEIRDVMEKRKQRIEELRQEITQIENDNDDLEKTISELLDSFG